MQYRLVTDGQTHDDSIYRASMALRGKNNDEIRRQASNEQDGTEICLATGRRFECEHLSLIRLCEQRLSLYRSREDIHASIASYFALVQLHCGNATRKIWRVLRPASKCYFMRIR